MIVPGTLEGAMLREAMGHAEDARKRMRKARQLLETAEYALDALRDAVDQCEARERARAARDAQPRQP